MSLSVPGKGSTPRWDFRRPEKKVSTQVGDRFAARSRGMGVEIRKKIMSRLRTTMLQN